MRPRNKQERKRIGLKKAKKAYRVYQFDSVDQDKRLLGIYSKTRTFCSNPDCCGNPRKSKRGGNRLTQQEIAAELKLAEELEEIEETIE